MKLNIKSLLACYIILVLFLGACASKPLIEKSDIKLTRDEPAKTCRSLGSIEVRSISVKANEKKLMEDLKVDAQKKGANFVKVETMGAQGTSIRGEAFSCP